MIKCSTMVEYEFGLFTNPHVSRVVAEEDTGILWLRPTGAGFVDSIPPTHSRWQRFPKRLIVRGGDGSIREICQWMHDRKEIRPVGILPGGSQNVLYHALMDLGLKANIKAFLEKSLDDYPEEQRLRPGMINDRVFVNHVGLGHVEQQLGRLNARLRLLPNGCRTLVATLFSLATASANPGKNFLNLYTITPRIGPVLAFPEQRLLNDELTHAWIRGGRIRQLRGSWFQDTTVGNYVWFDGDTRYYSQQEVLITRASYGIPVVAIT